MGAEQKETIILSIDDQTKPAVKTANAGMDSIEKKAVHASEAITEATEKANTATITVTERSKKAIDKLVEQATREAERMTMSKVEQLEAARSRKLAAVGKDNEGAAIQMAAAYDKMMSGAARFRMVLTME